MENDVRKIRYLSQRPENNSWLFRAVIPPHLRPLADGQREFKRTLGATRTEALAKYPDVLLEWTRYRKELDRQFESDQSLTKLVAKQHTPTYAYKYLNDRQRQQLAEVVEHWRFASQEGFTPSFSNHSNQQLDDVHDLLVTRQARVQRALRREEVPDELVNEFLGALEADTGFTLHPECPERQDFLLDMLAEEQVALAQTLAYLNGIDFPEFQRKNTTQVESSSFESEDEYIESSQADDWDSDPEDSDVLESPSTPQPVAPAQHHCQEAFDEWNKLETRKAKTVNEYRSYLVHFAQFVLGDQYQDLAHSQLTIATKRNVEAWLNHIAQERGVERKTLRKYRSALGTILKIALARDFITSNPVDAVPLVTLALKDTKAQVRKNAKEARDPFSPEQIELYFRGALFQNRFFDKRLPPAVAYWFPVLLRFTGARPLEVAFLMRDDIVEVGDRVWIYLYSDAQAPDQRERPHKTGVSLRRIPVSKHLLALGFLDYVRTIPYGSWLLPMPIGGSAPEERARYALKYLGQYLRKTLGITNPRLVTYSFRHTFIDEARLAKMSKSDRDALVGHAEGDHRDKNAGETVYGYKWYHSALLLDAIDLLDQVMTVPQGLPTWAQYQASP